MGLKQNRLFASTRIGQLGKMHRYRSNELNADIVYADNDGGYAEMRLAA